MFESRRLSDGIRRRRYTRRSFLQAGLAVSVLPSTAIAACESDVIPIILVNQVGYEPGGISRAILQGENLPVAVDFYLIESCSQKRIYFSKNVRTKQNIDWNSDYRAIFDFSHINADGDYEIHASVNGNILAKRKIRFLKNIIEVDTISNVLYYFKGARVGGEDARVDSHLALPWDEKRHVDLRGGWYDATGDYGVHFSHQNPTSFFNPQQAPLVAWSTIMASRLLRHREDDNFSEYIRRMEEEAIFGADFLVRMYVTGGAFLETIEAPGANKLSKDRMIGNPNWTTHIKTAPSDTAWKMSQSQATGADGFQTSFRAGGGMAVAALALVASSHIDGDFLESKYAAVARSAFRFLYKNNLALTNDGKENIIDDYCSLLAVCALLEMETTQEWQEIADSIANRLLGRFRYSSAYTLPYWHADTTDRPFFHPSDAGLPVISLCQYARFVTGERHEKVLAILRKSMETEMAYTDEKNNIFGYARQIVRRHDGQIRVEYFFPHDTEAAPWWQGENARLASLAAAARAVREFFSNDMVFCNQLEHYAQAQIDWLLGCNPYDVCMLNGSGEKNAIYHFFRSTKYTNAPGGIVNGITSGLDGKGIAFDEGYHLTGHDDDWRWTEQWLPHAAWYLYAVAHRKELCLAGHG